MNRAERRKAEKVNKQSSDVYREQQLMQQALELHRQGQLPQAKAAYRQIITLNPKQSHAFHMLGIVAKQQGDNPLAETLIRQALANDPLNSEIHANLGVVLMELSKRDEALAAFRQTLLLQPSNYEAAYQALKLLYQLKRDDEADAYSKQLLDAYRGQEMLSVVAIIAGERGNWDKAIRYYKEALTLLPDDINLWNNIGNAYTEHKEFDEAEKAYQRALQLNTSYAVTYYNRAGLYLAQEQFGKTEENYLKAIELDSGMGSALLNLSLLYVAQGRIEQAMDYGRRAFVAQPENVLAHSGYLFMMHYDPLVTAQQIAHESRVWAGRHTDKITRLPHYNKPEPERRLRVGYVSADFRKHAVNVYAEPVLKSHDKSQIELFCYSNSTINDEVTERLKSYADHWRVIHGLTDDFVADMIQKDEIDILVDLSGHTGGQRLQVFARKPAPLQATWIGYFNTTGMKAMDYIITDRFLLPPEDEHLYTEKPLRLPNSGAVYRIHDLPIAVNELPALTNGYITFGCYNALPKITPEVMRLWAEIMKQVPTSKLRLKNKSFDNPDVCKTYRKHFADLGVSEDRLILAGFSRTEDYLQEYNLVDLGLDPFPYNGATTTLDSLWMGVPMVTLKGDRLVAHIGESLLGAIGLNEFVGTTKEDYVNRAVSLANDLAKLAAVRKSLRPTLTASPMTNPEKFTRGLESAFRDIWREWCKTRA